MTHDHANCCPDGRCTGGHGTSRRGFLSLSAAAAGAALAAAHARTALATGTLADTALVPADKGLSPATIAGLRRRGTPTRYTDAGLRWIGMPVGGGCAGQVYLAGDGRLWHWNIDNGPAVNGTDLYAAPREVSSPFAQGFVLRTTVGGRTTTRSLDSTGFASVTFTGQYPIGQVEYRDPDCPVVVRLEAFAPFVPGETDDSTLPATVLAYTLTNTSSQPVAAEITGWSENPVCLRSRSAQPITLTAAGFGAAGHRGVQFAAEQTPAPQPERPDIVFEDWDRDTFDGWTVEGDAFGTGPARVSELPDYMLRFGDLGQRGDRLVTSHNFRRGDIGSADDFTGSLTSAPFTIERGYVTVRVGGGNHPGKTCVNVLVDGTVVGTATGENAEPMRLAVFDLTGHQGQTGQIQVVDNATGFWGHVNVDTITFTDEPPRPDIVFEDWERDTFDGWTVEGDAFGTGPVRVAELPAYMLRFGDMGAHGERFVTSHSFRTAGGDTGRADATTGKLTSAPFTIERRYIAVRVGGGNHPGQTCVNLVVDGEAVRSATGTDAEPMTVQVFDVLRYAGQNAHLEIVDTHTGAWGHVNVDTITFTDTPPVLTSIDRLTDGGTLAVVAFAGNAVVRPSIADWSSPAAVAESGHAPDRIDAGLGTLAGAVTVPVTVRSGQSRTVRFGLTWHFPVPDRRALGFLRDIGTLQKHYATRFDSARGVAAHLAGNLTRLEERTRTWVSTWYTDSTLPHWFLERTLATAATLATATCHRFSNGRFYAWEGVDCCAGTCEHVWNYAEALGRLFPELERDARERVDLGIGYHANTGEIGNRAEADMGWATDGQCGTILRIYREHTMSADNAFLARNWPRIKQALQWVIQHDGAGNGVVTGAQPNTLDAVWYGEVAWMSGMYNAALRAGAEMADDMRDTDFARQCRALADAGSAVLASDLWSGEYFIHLLDPRHPEAVNTNLGCHIDQMFGQTFAALLGLPRVFPEGQARTALDNIYRYNFSTDPAGYREANTEIQGGRWFAMKDEPGVLMTTFPHGGAKQAAGIPPQWQATYFNEVWTGQEYQLAAHMLYEGMVDHGLVVTRAIYDRYHGERRNPFDEVECSDHYARAMASYGVFLAACGFEYHGPRAHLGFAPKIQPEDFRAAFTAASGWGLYRQKRTDNKQDSLLELRHGQVRLRSLAFEIPSGNELRTVQVRHGPRQVRPASVTLKGTRVELTFVEPVTVRTGTDLSVTLHWSPRQRNSAN